MLRSLSPELRFRARVMIGVVVLLVLISIILAIQSRVVRIFVVISDSMEPTLLIGDRIVIDTKSYPDRFDVVSLQDPEHMDDPKEQLVKRVIGLEGDVIAIEDGILLINGEEQYSRHVASNTINWRDVRIKVPEDHIFVLGDNRNHSYDSLNFGPVSEENITGVLSFIVWPPSRFGPVDDFTE